MSIKKRHKRFLKKAVSSLLAACMILSTFSTAFSTMFSTPLMAYADSQTAVLSQSGVNVDSGAAELSPNATPEATEESAPSEAPEATEDPSSSSTPKEEEDSSPTASPEATETPIPNETPEASEEPTATPKPSEEPTATSKPSTAPEPSATPEVEEFVALEILASESTIFTAETGEKITMSSDVNRDDVKVSYQWQRIQMKPAGGIYFTDPLYEYTGEQPTYYSFRLSDKSEAEYLKAHPDATWPGVEMYHAVIAALESINADTSSVSIAWKTPNYILKGWEISAENVGEEIKIYVDKDGERVVGVKNNEGKWEFGDAEEYVPEWKDIEDATDSEYTFTVHESDYNAMYRCVVTVLDEEYKEICKDILAEQGTELTEEQLAEIQRLYSPGMSVENPNAEPVTESAQTFLALDEDNRAVVGFPQLSDDVQWITGLNGSYEYITKDTYDRVTEWLNEGKITQEQADYFWTYLHPKGFYDGAYYANVLDENGFPTGDLRTYNGFNLTDGMLEVNSEWYGKTVYFRTDLDGKASWSVTGTAIDIPAYTDISKDEDGDYSESTSGSRYKKAITILNPYVLDTGSVYQQYLELDYITTNSSYSRGKGWILNDNGKVSDNHITIYAVSCEKFNADPNRFMMDAEGNYRMDSVAWGVCTSEEPDISGKAYWRLKDYIANGYGFMAGHDTMYAYAGAYYDAFGTDLDEDSIDPNDGTTWYYDINSWMPGTTASTYERDSKGEIIGVAGTSETRGGHFYMNELMGANGGNVNSGTVSPYDAPSLILSTGGSNGEYGKNIQYGSNQLEIAAFPYSSAQAKAHPKYRTPTNYPFAFSAGQIFESALTHTNQQAAFGTLWTQYSGGNIVGKPYGYYEDAKSWTVDEKTGTNNFYLSGTGNFLMNQIGHLPYNNATIGEAKLFANSVFYVSQRKQCEICAAGQHGDEAVHFVHRINSANAEEILTVLSEGGNYWYSLDDCYMLVDDITLPKDWTPIKDFSGHWNSDVYDVTLNSKGTPLLENTDVPAEKYNTGTNNGWNLGDDKTQGVMNVFKTDGSGIRTTGVARVVGDLNDLFGTKTSYAGYTVKILGKDNPNYMDKDDVYDCTVNTDSKYVISNLPCVYDSAAQTGILRARVYAPDGKEITEYGVIRVDVDQDFWDNDMTTPLYLAAFKAQPVANEKTYESSKAVFTAETVSSDAPSLVRWQYRTDSSSEWTNVPESWGTVTSSEVKTLETGDQHRTASLTLPDVNPTWNGYEFRAVWESENHGTWSSYDFYQSGISASLTANDGVYKKIAMDGHSGKLTVKLWPARTSQGANRTVYEGESTTFTSQGFILDANGKIDYKWQYSTKVWNSVTGEYDTVWKDVDGSEEFGSSYEITKDQTVLASDSENSNSGWNTIKSVYSKVTGDDDLEQFAKNASFYEVNTTLKISKVDIRQDNTRFRVVYTSESKYRTEYTVASNVADELNWKWVETNEEFDEANIYGQVEAVNTSNLLTVKLPELLVQMQEANKFTDSAQNVDPNDALGQRLVLPTTTSTVADGTAVYRALIYYLPQQHEPTVNWEYRTYKDASAKPWTQEVAGSLGYTDVKVTFTNTDKGQEVMDGRTYNVIESVMTISNAPLSMYDTDSYLKYFFRCKAGTSYETSKGTKANIKVDSRDGYQWAGLTMDYSIAIRHNGVLGYGGTNKLSADNFATINTVNSISEIVDASQSSGRVVWMYPNLDIEIPDGRYVNTVIVWFDEDYPHSASDYIGYNATKMAEYGIQVSSHGAAPCQSITFTSVTKNGVSIANWESFLRSYVSFSTFDDIDYSKISEATPSTGARIKWHADENKIDGVTVDSSTGKAYVVKTTTNSISWTDAKTAAAQYNSDLGLNGYLVEINDAAENTVVKNLLDGKEAWLGFKNSTSGWKYATSSGTPSYYNWMSGTGLDKTKSYMYMKTDGTWNSSNGTTTTTKTYTLHNQGANAWANQYIGHSTYLGETVSYNVKLTKGHKYYVLTGYGDYYDSNSGGSIVCNAFGINVNHNWNSNWNEWASGVDGIYSFNGTSGSYPFVYTTTAMGTDITGLYCCFSGLNVIDLTATFGAGSEPSLAQIRNLVYGSTTQKYKSAQKLLENVGYIGSKEVSYTTQADANIKAYVIEYDLDSLGMAITNHSAEDTDYIGRRSKAPVTGKNLTVSIAGNEKLYDKQIIAPESFSVIGDDGAHKGLVQITYTAEDAPHSGYSTSTVNGSDWQNTGIVNTGLYKATISLTAEAEADGWTIDIENSTLTADLIIRARPVDVYSNDNDKIYDGSTMGTIDDIKPVASGENSGIVAGDTVLFNTTSASGFYTSDGTVPTIHNSKTNNGGEEWTMLRDISKSSLYITHTTSSDPYHNYYLDKETYSGDIIQRGVVVHSRYLDDPESPRNVKIYDSSDEATISDILIDHVIQGDNIGVKDATMKGTYEMSTAGEELNADGTPKTGRMKKLDEYTITAATNATLTGNTFGDYYIAKEEYTGAIARATLEARVKSWRGVYGTGMSEEPWHDTEAYKAGKTATSGCWLSIDGLVGSDELALNSSKSDFAVTGVNDSDMIVTETTPVGTYPLTYEGLTESNYTVLSNYIVGVQDGVLKVEPREIVVDVDDADKMVGDENPPFYSTFYLRQNDDSLKSLGSDLKVEYSEMKLIGSDTVASTILVQPYGSSSIKDLTKVNGVSNITYLTDCVKDSAVLYGKMGDYATEPCAFCEEYHGMESGTDHWPVLGYEVSINQVPEDGNVLVVASVKNPLGEDVQNYVLTYRDGSIKVHPEIQFQLEATVPLIVCMYGYRADGEVVEPTNYGITNYSAGAIKITNINVGKDGWRIVPESEDLKAGEMYMNMNGIDLRVGDNIPSDRNNWIIDKAEDHENRIGTYKKLPLTCRIAGGDVNEAGETYVTKVCYTISGYGKPLQ